MGQRQEARLPRGAGLADRLREAAALETGPAGCGIWLGLGIVSVIWRMYLQFWHRVGEHICN